MTARPGPAIGKAGAETMSETIHVCLISDAAYARQLLVAMTSILATAGPEDVLAFHIVDGGLGEETRRSITRLRRLRPFVCHYLEARPVEMARFPRHRCAPCAYYRVLLPRLLPELDKLIYLDCDLIALGSLLDLWRTRLEGKGLAAARDFTDYVKHNQATQKHLTGFGFDLRNHYCNSGVMLLNLEKMRRQDFETRFFEARSRLDGRIRFSDQDIYNYLFQEDLVLLDQGWNVQAPLGLLPENVFDFSGLDLRIIHYTTDVKPWDQELNCLFKQEYQAMEKVLDTVLAI